MPFLFFAALALIGAAIHRHRDKQPRSAARTIEIFLVWWMVVAVGVAAIFGAMFHLFDGPNTAREIGYTNGDGGFQTEVGFADLAIGVLGVLCARYRDGFLLAAVTAVSISYLGDAYGHLHQEAIHDNHDPDNTGLLLWSDFIAPLVAIGLYLAHRRAAKALAAAAAAAVLALALVSCGGGSGDSSSTAAEKPPPAAVVKLTATTHRPRVGAPWPITLEAHDRKGHPLRAEVRYRYLFGGAVVARRSHYRFRGVFHDTFHWPARAAGLPLTFRAVVTTPLGVRRVDYPVRVRK